MDLDTIVQRVASHRPKLRRGDAPAATALILHEHRDLGLSILFVERAVRRGDRWSGQMALPGGRRHAEDRDLTDTAIRETKEEVGVVLDEPVGRLDDQGGRTSGVTVATFVFTLDEEPTIVPDPAEVAGTVWIPLDHLRSETAPTLTFWKGFGPFPAWDYEGYVVWGLTHRIITSFVGVIEEPR